MPVDRGTQMGPVPWNVVWGFRSRQSDQSDELGSSISYPWVAGTHWASDGG